MALAAWNFVYWSRLPTTFIEVRLSSTASTSGGNEMFWMTSRGTLMPMSARFVVNVPASVAPIVCWFAARSSIGDVDELTSYAVQQTHRSAPSGVGGPSRDGTAQA